MRDYQSIREEWIQLRKIPKQDKLEIDFIKQAVIGLIIDKTTKLAKADSSVDYNKYLLQSIKSEHKQTLEAIKQGVDAQKQLDVLEALLPQSLSEEETTAIILDILTQYEKPNMGLVMKELKKIDNVDMKIASKLVKELI